MAGSSLPMHKYACPPSVGNSHTDGAVPDGALVDNRFVLEDEFRQWSDAGTNTTDRIREHNTRKTLRHLQSEDQTTAAAADLHHRISQSTLSGMESTWLSSH